MASWKFYPMMELETAESPISEILTENMNQKLIPILNTGFNKNWIVGFLSVE